MTAQLDELASSLERKWGIDRLPRLMPEAWRAKFDALKIQLDRVITAGTDTTAAAEALAKAWRAMDAQAVKQGSFPIDARCYEVRRDGMTFAIAPDAETAQAASLLAQWEKRAVTVYTAEALLEAALANPTLRAIHATFSGATVATAPAEMRPGKRRANLGHDEIPFGGKAFTGARCADCGSPQWASPSGITCDNGHGGADAEEAA